MNKGIVNDAFHAKTKALVQSAIALLISYIQKGEEIPLQISETYKVTGPGGWSMEYEDKPDYDVFILHHEKEIEALPEFRLWMEAVSADPVVSRHIGHVVGTRHGMINRSAWEYLSDLVLAHFPAMPGGLAFDPETFERKYRDMEVLFYNDMIGFKLFSPLQNFESDAAVIDLGGGLKIKKITTQELEELLNASKWSPLIPSNEVITFRYSMEFTFETEKYFLSIPLSALEEGPEWEIFGKLVTALRLFKVGAIGYNMIRETPLIDTPHLFGGTRGGLGYRRYWGPQYSLKVEEVDAFKGFWKQFGTIELGQRAPIGIAIRRFNYAYERFGLEDKLIDHMIAFEALFFKTGEIGENRHKLSVRVAKLLAQDYENRRRIAKEMAGFYDMRNLVVHGEQASLKPEFTGKIENYLRDSIKYFLLLPQATDHDEIISRLNLE